MSGIRACSYNSDNKHRYSNNRSKQSDRSYSSKLSDQNESSNHSHDDYYRNKNSKYSDEEQNFRRRDGGKKGNENYHNSRYSRKNAYDDKPSLNAVSPLKRRNGDDSVKTGNLDSPSKRLRENKGENVYIKRFNLSSYRSPKKGRSSSLCTIKKDQKYFSTPKSERRCMKSKVEKMIEQNSIAAERNLSNNWADILEELEEQAKEVENYIAKVVAKFNIDGEKLRQNMETNTELLRKRQKQVNYGKVTAEYQRYLLEIPKKQRQSYHPKTPNKFRKCSRRMFDGAVKKWRKLLHAYDEDPEQLEDMKSSDSEFDNTDDFGGASNVGSGISGYNIDDFDIIDSDPDERLMIDTPKDAI